MTVTPISTGVIRTGPTPQWALILTDDPATITTLTGILKISQTEAIDDFLEESCWSDSLPDFVGHKGTAAQRLAALRGQYRKEMADRRRQAGYVDYDLLTPLEHELYKVVLSVKISGCAQKAGTLDKDVKGSQGGPRSRDQPDAPGGQGRGG